LRAVKLDHHMKTNLTIIIPFLNEGIGLVKLTTELNKYIRDYSKISTEVVFVDDGSTDDSVSILKKQKFSFSVKLVKLSKNFGSHSALRAGIEFSSSLVTVFLPSDLQDPLSLIEKMFAKINEGYPTVWAKRINLHNHFFNDFGTRMYAKMMKIFVAPNYPENGFDVVMFNEKVKNELKQNPESNSSIYLQIMNLGFKNAVVEYEKQKRKIGRSKWTFSKKIKLLLDSFVAFSYAPIRLVSLIGGMLFLSGLIWSTYIVIRAVVSRNLNPGWPSMIAILTIGFGLTNLSLGIIAEYLWRTLDAARHRKVYIVDELINL
jgi:polyisoprenyl-phosphate glycosyltransferase